jgi:hypothetical protein
MAGVFQNIDPPPPSPPGECVLWRGGRTTEYTELQPLLSGVHSVMRVKFALAGEGGGCTTSRLASAAACW